MMRPEHWAFVICYAFGLFVLTPLVLWLAGR